MADTKRLVGDSAALETTFTTPDGVLRLTDAMPVADVLYGAIVGAFYRPVG